MKSSKLLTTAALAAAFTLGLATSAYTFERHPELVAAERALNNAMSHLEHANQDFGGHRVKAMEHIKQALGELQLAFAADAR